MEKEWLLATDQRKKSRSNLETENIVSIIMPEVNCRNEDIFKTTKERYYYTIKL